MCKTQICTDLSLADHMPGHHNNCPNDVCSCSVSGGTLSSKAKRAKCSTHKQRVTVMLYNKVCDIIINLSELLEIQLLTDTTILQVRV